MREKGRGERREKGRGVEELSGEERREGLVRGGRREEEMEEERRGGGKGRGGRGGWREEGKHGREGGGKQRGEERMGEGGGGGRKRGERHSMLLCLLQAGADIAKLATTATDISHSISVLSLLSYSKGNPWLWSKGAREQFACIQREDKRRLRETQGKGLRGGGRRWTGMGPPRSPSSPRCNPCSLAIDLSSHAEV